MISLFKILVLVLVFLVPAMAASEQTFDSVNPEKHRWLYNLVMPANDRSTQPDKAFNSFSEHLKDTNEYFPTPSHISVNHLNAKKAIQGKITYVEIFPKKYSYDVIYTPNSTDVTLRVKVSFFNPKDQDIESFRKKFAQAEQIWNSNQIPFDFKYRFQFQVITNASEAHFTTILWDDTRGPYDTNWNRNWSANSVAHELGHMLGLGDEYETITSEHNCLAYSLMCYSHTGKPMYHHYYFILRRLMK